MTAGAATQSADSAALAAQIALAENEAAVRRAADQQQFEQIQSAIWTGVLAVIFVGVALALCIVILWAGHAVADSTRAQAAERLIQIDQINGTAVVRLFDLINQAWTLRRLDDMLAAGRGLPPADSVQSWLPLE